MGFFIYLIERILSLFFNSFGVLYTIVKLLFIGKFKELNNYFFNVAVSGDKRSNVIMADLFNDIFIKKNGYQFGNGDETISSVLGKNKEKKDLLEFGEDIANDLDKIQPNHVEDAIDNNLPTK